MLTIYRRRAAGQTLSGHEMPEDVVWVDLLSPPADEK